MQHANAPLTPTGRYRMVMLVERDGLTFEAAAAASNVAKSTVHLWVSRWRAASVPEREALACLEDRRSTPRSSPHQVLRRGGCSRLARPERPAVVRYEWPCPGQLLHMDVKKLGRFEAPGHALTADRTSRSRGVGWEYVHSIVDDCSRLAYAEIHPDECAETATGFTERALDWFLEQGIVAERLMTDNHFSYTRSHSFRRLLWRRQIRHIRIRPYTPRTNGKVERFHQTLMREWAYALEYASSAARREALPHWIDHYNERRTHSALGTGHPASAFGTSSGSTASACRSGAAASGRRSPRTAR
jgi:hypothetical protein